MTTPYRARWLARPARSRPAALAGALLAEARASLPFLAESQRDGFFLENGGLLATDGAGELVVSTPECCDPWTAVQQHRAGERCVRELLTRLGVETAAAVAIEPGTGGWREWFFTRDMARESAEQLVPHLVSRAVYAGAGGFDPTAAPLRFVVSPAAFRIDSRVARLVVAERRPRRMLQQPAGDGGIWFEILPGEQPASDVAAVLSLGVTALITLLIAQGRRPGAAVTLRHPLQAWRTYSADPGCAARARLADGRSLTAIEIQDHYLEQVERYAAELPEWAGRLMATWRAQLEQLRRGAAPVALGWPCLMARLEATIRMQPGWQGFREWNERWGDVLKEMGFPWRPAAEREDTPERAAELDLAVAQWRTRGGPAVEGGVRYFRLRSRLLDAEAGFRRLKADDPDPAGRLFGEAEIARARTIPPSDTRAAVRGKWVRRLGATEARSRFRCDWTQLSDLVAGTVLDLADPWATQAEWQSAALRSGQGDLFSGIRDWLNLEF